MKTLLLSLVLVSSALGCGGGKKPDTTPKDPVADPSKPSDTTEADKKPADPSTPADPAQPSEPGTDPCALP